MEQDRDFVYIRNRPIRHQVACREWVCGVCESRLKTIWNGGDHHDDRLVAGFKTVCAKNPSHPADGFIHQNTLERRVHEEMVQAGNLRLAERRTGMGLKDRDTAYGTPRRMRLSRIGRVRQGIMATSRSGKKYPKAVDYFILDPTVEDDAERDEILAEVRAAIEEYAPEQDLEEPTVLPVIFLASDDAIIAPESYKVRKGRQGTVWCAGDGEYIQWKLSDDFRVEIAGGAEVDSGVMVPCPGGRQEGRHEWCQDCKAEIEINFAIVGYERTGMWMLRTSSMTFRDQFWTQIGIVREMARKGIIPGLVGVPFLLRRQKEAVLSPVGANGALATVEMPLTTIEIHPAWFQEMMRANPRLSPGQALAASEARLPAAIPERVGDQALDWSQYQVDGEKVIVTPPPGTATQSSATLSSPHAPQAPATTTQQANGNRPYEAWLVRGYLRKKSGVWHRGPADDWSDAHRDIGKVRKASREQVGALASLIGNAAAREGDGSSDKGMKRHSILEYCLGLTSTNDVSDQECRLWINLWKSPDSWDPTEIARQEAQAVLRAYLKDAGQQELPLEPASAEAGAEDPAEEEPPPEEENELDALFPRDEAGSPIGEPEQETLPFD